jgi:hypothetical protein
LRNLLPLRVRVRDRRAARATGGRIWTRASVAAVRAVSCGERPGCANRARAGRVAFVCARRTGLAAVGLESRAQLDAIEPSFARYARRLAGTRLEVSGGAAGALRLSARLSGRQLFRPRRAGLLFAAQQLAERIRLADDSVKHDKYAVDGKVVRDQLAAFCVRWKVLGDDRSRRTCSGCRTFTVPFVFDPRVVSGATVDIRPSKSIVPCADKRSVDSMCQRIESAQAHAASPCCPCNSTTE